jgi:CheY-like chemotaxis protein
VNLPAVTELPAKKPQPAEAARETKLPYRILLAEDGPDNQRLINYFLTRAGATVTLADNGWIALNVVREGLARGEQFDCVLMDVQMPVMDGYQATMELRRERYTGPIIALTANAMTHDRQLCLDAGCDDYATKPIDRLKLLELVDRHVQRTRQQREATDLQHST